MKKRTVLYTGVSLLLFAGMYVLTGCNSSSNTAAPGEAMATDTPSLESPLDTVALTDEATADTATGPATAVHKPLTLIIRNLESPTGPVYVSFYNTKNKFPSPTDRIKEYKFMPKGKMLTVSIDDLDYADLALATYQDVNDDGKCNTNMIGIPKEPYGFSQDYRPKVRAPKFEECMFVYNAKKNKVVLSMIR